MGDLIEKAMNFLQSEDCLDTLYTFFREHYELLLIVAAVIFIFVLCLWTMLERLQKRGAVALIPVYRFVVLFKGVGINPWLAILMIIPGVNLFMRLVFYIYVARRFDRSYLMVPGLVVLPLIFLPIVSFGDGSCPHIRIPRQKKARQKTQASLHGAKNKKAELPFIAIEPTDADARKRQGRKIVVEGNDTPEEIYVLTMAELRQKRAEGKEKKATLKARQRIGAEIAPLPKLKYEVHKPSPVDKRADRMPEMKQGPRGMIIAQEKVKAQEVKGGEYEKLLRRQQAAQKKREDKKPVKKIKPTVNGVTRKQKKPQPQKQVPGRILKVD